jgi:hypothetical protein
MSMSDNVQSRRLLSELLLQLGNLKTGTLQSSICLFHPELMSNGEQMKLTEKEKVMEIRK